MEFGCSVSFSQQLTADPYPEPNEPNQYPPNLFVCLKCLFQIFYSRLCLGLASRLSPSGFSPHQMTFKLVAFFVFFFRY